MNIKTFFKNIEVNVFDVNFVLTFVGFSAFTSFFPEISSISYRALTLIFAVYCLCKKNYKFPHLNRMLKIFLFLIIALVLKTSYELYLGDYAFTFYTDSRDMVMLFLYGIMFLPLLVCIKGIPYYNPKSIFLFLFLILVIILAMSVFNSSAVASNDGRFSLNERQSTLTLGDNGSYLIVLCAALLAKYKEYGAYGIPKVFFFLGLIIGIMSILKAGSRGPVLASMSGCFFIILNLGLEKKIKLLLSCLFFFFFWGGYEKLENYAPVLFNRLGNSIQNGDMNGRDTIFTEALNIIINGHICGSSPVQLLPNGNFIGWHNYFLSFGVGFGFMGFVFVICFFLLLLLTSYKKRNKIKTPFELFIIAMLWLICARGISGISPVSHCVANFIVVFSCFILHNKHNLSVDRKLDVS